MHFSLTELDAIDEIDITSRPSPSSPPRHQPSPIIIDEDETITLSPSRLRGDKWWHLYSCWKVKATTPTTTTTTNSESRTMKRKIYVLCFMFLWLAISIFIISTVLLDKIEFCKFWLRLFKFIT
jgi:hypothetical protein